MYNRMLIVCLRTMTYCCINESTTLSIQYNSIIIENRTNLNGTRSMTVKNGANSNSKALSTTLIVLGTYLVCWGPAVTFQVLTCIDGCPFPILKMEPITRWVQVGLLSQVQILSLALVSYDRVTVSFLMNTCVCMKSLVDPFIYTLRMKEIRLAFTKFYEAISGRRSDHHRRQNTTSYASTSWNHQSTHRGRYLSTSSPNGSDIGSMTNGVGYGQQIVLKELIDVQHLWIEIVHC